MDIAKINERTIEKITPQTIQYVEDVLEVDHLARKIAAELI